MGVMDRYNKKKKQEEEESKSESSSLGGVQSRFEVNKTLGPSNHEVNESFINKFVSDVNNFLGSAEEEIGTVGWSNASSIYDTRYNSWKDLYSRSNSISRWLDENKSNLTEDSYKSLSSNLNSFRTNSSSVLDSFKSARDYYSAWDSEVDYNRWYEKTKKQEEERAAVLGAEDFDKYFNQGNEYGEEQSVWDKLTGKAYNSIANMRNDPNALKVYEESAKGANGASWGTSERVLTNQIEYKAAKYMTDDEFKVYNYYYGKDAENGTDTAKKFLESIEESLNMRAADEKFADLEGRTFKELLFGVTAGLDQFESGLINLFDSKSDYIPATPTQMTSGMVREDLADNGAKLPDWMGGASIGQMGYDMVTTTSNMLPSILTSAVANVVAPGSGAIIGAGLLGASASGNAYAEMLNLGYDKGQARAYSLLVGAAEAGLQYALGGISKLGGKVSGNAISKFVSKFDNAIARAAIKLGGNMLSEGLEESIQSVLEPVFKSISTGEEFEGIAWDEVLYSGLMGAMSAGILEGTGTISGEVTAYTKGKALKETGTESIDRLVSLGQTFSADSVAYQLAGKVNEQAGAYTIGRLLNEVGASLSEQNKADITKALVEKGMTSKDANTISKWLGKAVDGGYFTKGQIAALESNEVISSVFQDVIINQNSTVNQRIQGYNESLHTLAEEMSRGKAVEKATEAQQTSSEPTAMLSNEEFVRRVSEATGLDATAVAQGFARQENDVPLAKNTTVEEIATEGKFKASQTGKAKIGDTEVSIKEIASVKGGEMILRLEDGSTVNASDVEYGSSAEALIYESVTDMNLNAATANAFVKGYEQSEGLSAQEYVLGFREAYRYGEYGFPVQEMSKDGFSAKLSQTQRSLAYDLGKTDMKYKVAENQSLKEKIASTSAKNAEKIASTGTKKGKVHYAEGILVKNITQRQKASLKGLERLAEALGVEFHIFESEVGENGKRKGANGWFDPKDGSIHLDLHAGAEGEGTILFTAAHELTHFIREWSPEKFKVFADFLLEQYGQKGISVDALVRNQIDKAKRNGRDIDFDTAYEEVIADSCESMLADGEIMQKLAELKAKDKTLWEKIKSFIADLVAKIKAAYEGLSPDSIEGRYVAEMLDAAERLKELWTEALVDASEASSLVEIDAETESVSPMFSERTWTESEYVTEREKAAKAISNALNVDIKTAYKYIDDINGVARLIADDRARLDYEPNLDDKASVLKPNSEYKYSVDMSTLCAKRLLFTGTFDAIQKALPNTVFDSEDIVSLREMMQKRGYEVACGICYVESTRREIGRITQEFIDRYKVAQQTGEPISRINSSGKEVVLKSEGRTFSADKDYTPNLGELNTTDIDIVKRDHREVYDAYLAFMNARGQAKPKLLETRAEYKGEILKHFKAKSAVEARNNAGGLRLQSFSDFEVPHLIDMMQVVMDMSRVGLKSQAYTKVPAFAEVFGDSGVKINLSLIAKGDGLDANGNLVFDDVEGINHKEAFRLRDQYSKNVGTILVGKTDAHIIAAMADPRIDYIIPFHKSSWKESLYDALGLTGYADYTDFQNEKPIDKDRKIKNFDPSEYWDFTKSGDENAQIYLEKCREDGRIPKFTQFQGYPGYWKLLIDFKMYDNDGVGSPQEVVSPIFNTEASERILREYEGGHKSFPVAKDVVEDFVKEHKDIRYSDRYQSADTNSDILSMVEKVESGDFKANDKVDLGTVSDSTAAEIYNITGINVEGFKVAIEARQINHIIKDHGKNGLADRSMADPSDIAKIEFALEDYDDIRAAGKTQAYTHMVNGRNKTADTVLYEKSIGEKAYYVVQAVPNTRAKTLYIVTAFIGKKGYKKEASQLIDAKSPDATAKTGSADTSVHSISQTDESVKREFSDVDVKYSIREEAPPKNTMEGYKVFVVKNGKLYPPMVANPNAEDTPVGVWLNADVGTRAPDSKTGRMQVKAGGKGTQGGSGSLAFRPGWHLGETPLATQFDRLNPETGVKELFPENFVWALCDIAADHDYQEEAMSYGYTKNGKFQHSLAGLPKLPTDGYYKYRTNPNPDTVPWLITGAMKVKKLLSDAEVNAILAENGIAPKQRVGGDKTLADLGLSQYEGKLFSDRDPDSVSNRSLLANALESVAQNDIERNKLKEYKGKIALIESEQAKLAETKAKIKELSFAKGKRDTEAIKKLQFEANQSANRINTYDRQLLNLEATAALKGVLQREKQLAYKKAEREGKDALAKYREKAAKTQRELLTRYQESRAKGVEGRKKTEMRYKIKSITSELDTLLRRPTSKKHIKEELRAEVADALLAINMDTIGADERVARYNEMIAKAKDPDIIAELTKTRDRIQLQGDNLKEKLTSLQSAYEKIKASDDIELSMSYQEVIRNSIKNVTDKVGNTSIRNMSLEQLEMVYDLFSMIRKTIRNANKAFNEQKGQTIMQMAEAVNDQVRTVGGQPYERSAVVAAVQRAGWALLKPYVAFRTIGSVTLTNLYKELRNGEDTFYGDVKEAQAFIEEQYEKHGYKSWDMKTTKTFTAKSGKSFDLTLEQIMTLYAYSRREQAHKHIIEGGVVFENAIITKKNKLGVPIKYEVTTKDAFNLSEETFAEIANSLTAEQKAFVDAMQEYLSKTMGAKGNEVSMELLGVKLFKEEFYLPIKSSQDYRNFSAEEAGEVKLKSPAFSKETVQQANNPIVLHNFTDLWAEHINDMSMYHSFVLALEDFTRVYNYKTKTDAKVETMSTKATLETAFPGATTYINKFLKDMNGGVRSETVGGLEKLTSLAKKGAVLGSASVAIQQPSAVMRAMAMVDPKHFVATTLKSLNLVKHKQDWAELKKYAPIAGIKEMGRFDVGMGQETVDWIKANKTVMNKVEDGLSIAPALMDEITWVSIWNAVKRETLHNRKDLRPGSEEFFKAAGERFTDVISLTQVYDSVFSRSDIMRNKSWIAKAATAFMAEPTTTLNMIIDSFVQGKRTGSKKGFFKNTVPVSGAIVASYVINAALKSIITAARDDDEDESYAEKYLEHFFGDFKDSLNPLTLVPVAKDIVSIFRGYDVERMDMSLFSDFSKAIEAFSSDNKTLYEKWSGLISATSAFFGIPVKNVERDVRAAINVIFGKRESSTKRGLLDAISEGWTGETKSNGQQLYEAMLSGDTAQTERVKGRFKDDKAITSAIRTALRENDSRIHDAAVARYSGNISEYTRIAREIIAEGNFKQDDVVAAINSEINALKKADGKDEAATSDSNKATSIYKMEDYYAALIGRDQAAAHVVKEDILKVAVANGKDRDEAEADFNSSFASHLREEYEAGNLTDNEAVNMLVEYGGKTEEGAGAKVQYWEFKQRYPDYDLSEEAVTKYFSDVEPSGIDVEVYYDYSKKRSKCKGVDLNGDGKTDSGSVKREVLEVINSLPISYQQKDVLYYLNGWSASTIWEAPWH